jgi:hypothetical protein
MNLIIYFNIQKLKTVYCTIRQERWNLEWEQGNEQLPENFKEQKQHQKPSNWNHLVPDK